MLYWYERSPHAHGTLLPLKEDTFFGHVKKINLNHFSEIHTFIADKKNYMYIIKLLITKDVIIGILLATYFYCR